jgi:hypothetical protein
LNLVLAFRVARCAVVCVALAACGGVTRNPTHDEPLGGTDAGGSGGAVTEPVVAGHGGVGGSGEGGSVGGVGGASAGAGGKIPDPVAGGPSELSCAVPYEGSSGGPRVDGPMPISDCAGVSDALIVERFKDFAARVPQGLYYEPKESISFWNEPCSTSLADTIARGPTDHMGELDGTDESAWFYEASYCTREVRRREKNLRCDYFDGKTLSDLDPKNYAFFASLLWWTEHANVSGAAILGHSLQIGNATNWLELCTIEGRTGDFGRCDEIQLIRTKHRIMYDGAVTLGKPETLRTVKGDCH